MNEKRKQRIVDRHTRDDEFVQRDALRSILATPEGRRFIWGLIGETGLFVAPPTGNALDMARATGRMDIGQLLLERIEAADKRAFLRMQEENMKIEEALAAKLTEDDEDEYANDDG